jgi:SAM-dependent methyltransferase
MGRWSRLAAREFIRWLDPPANGLWLDVGCGTGTLTRVILQTASPARVKGIDRSAGFIAFAREQVSDPRAVFETGDAQVLRDGDGSYDAAVSGLALNFFPDPGGALGEMARVTRPDGTVACYVWDYAGGMELLRHFWDAAAALDPAALDLDEGRRFPLCQLEPLKELFLGADLKDIEVRAIDIPTVFKDFDDFWSPFLGGQGPAAGYAMSLSVERRDALRERIRCGLPFAPDGSISLSARAWAARGLR